MLSKTKTEEYLRTVVLPEQTKSYTVIPHGDIIDEVRSILTENGFIIEEELYKASDAGREAVGFMQISRENEIEDLDVNMTFNWTNSYNKKLRFSCGIGGYIKENKTPFITSAKGTHWKRKHSGTALDEAKETIIKIVNEAKESYDNILEMKEKFKDVSMDRKQYAKLIGLLFFDKKVIFPEQANIIRNEYDKPEHSYTNKDSLWYIYQIIMHALKEQVPSKWYQQQLRINSYVQLMFGTAKEDEIIITNKEDIEDIQQQSDEVEVVHATPTIQNIVEAEEYQEELTEMALDNSEDTDKQESELAQKDLEEEEKEEEEKEELTCENCGSNNCFVNSSAQVICDNCGHEEITTMEEEEEESYNDNDVTSEEDIAIEEEEEETLEINMEDFNDDEEVLEIKQEQQTSEIPTDFTVEAIPTEEQQPQKAQEDPLAVKIKEYIKQVYKIQDADFSFSLDESEMYVIASIIDTNELITIPISSLK